MLAESSFQCHEMDKQKKRSVETMNNRVDVQAQRQADSRQTNICFFKREDFKKTRELYFLSMFEPNFEIHFN